MCVLPAVLLTGPIHPSIPSHPSNPKSSDVEFDPQAVSIIRQNWIDKQLKKR